jgi:hypothetical protein
MYSNFFENIYNFFLHIYDSLIPKKNKEHIHKYDECDDEEYLFLNQGDELQYLEQTIER